MTTDNIDKLADDYAKLKLQIEALEDQIKLVKKQIIATGRDVIVGSDFKVKVDLRERKTIPYEKAKAEVSPEILAKITNVSEFEVINYKPVLH